MFDLNYTLLADGGSDRVLIPIINWLFDTYHPDIRIRPRFAENLPVSSLEIQKRVEVALRLYPCDLLFVHRDAERVGLEQRLCEIKGLVNNCRCEIVPVIPVRMTEAWLFSDEKAIRSAAGNENGRLDLNLPPPKEWDQLPDPKRLLFLALESASGLTGRRLKRFYPEKARHLVAERTTDFSGLERLPAFLSLRDQLQSSINLIRSRGR